MKLLVTVGTTRFDKLVNAVLDDEFIAAAQKLNFHEIVLQYGRSQLKDEQQSSNGMVKCLPYIDVLEMGTIIEGCQVVIGHAGSGTALDVLRGPITSLYPPRTPTCPHSTQTFTNARRPPPSLILVPNTDLMDNHQIEVAEELNKLECVTLSTPNPQALISALQKVASHKPVVHPLPPVQAQLLNCSISTLLKL